jgi:hypothetical protein
MPQFPNTTNAQGVWSLKKQKRLQQGSNWPAYTPPVTTAFSALFNTNSITSMNISTANAWTIPYNYFSNHQSCYSLNAGAFWSYISTSDTSPIGANGWVTEASVPSSNQTSTFNSISATETLGYNVPQGIIWSTPADGVWMSSNSDTSIITVTSSNSATVASHKYLIVRGYGSNYSYHNAVVIKVVANGITRYFSLQDMTLRSSPTNTVYVGYYAPLNSSFTSFLDSRLTGASTTLPASYFEWT